MKKLAKKFVVSQLAGYVRKLREDNELKIVAVVGSIGKTSTKFAVARVLGEHYRVQFQEGNYNDIVTVPLVFFGLDEPSLFNPLAWAKTFRQIKKSLKQHYPYDVVVVELGVDGVGQMKAFADYLEVDITVVSAITPEHMEFFADMDAVAAEEFGVADYSKQLIINADLTEGKYFEPFKEKALTYGKSAQADYVIGDIKFEKDTGSFSLVHRGKTLLAEEIKAVSVAELYSAASAAAVAEQLGLSSEEISAGIKKLVPVSGRMQRLKGIKDSLIIDETYNASPIAVKAALDSLYELKASQKIAILGNMNELGEMSPEAHKEVGRYCEPKQLDLVITLGLDANAYLAPAAKQRGCQVKTFDNPYDVGTFLQSFIKDDAIVLAKGSQNGVFAEEAIKLLLADSSDAELLVRQSAEWLKKKEKQFKG
jgi:UDP-N-acetylmuramoyl-tripeptide--D-alanyl-D-alanine ligase